jgi:hypothetical protein
MENPASWNEAQKIISEAIQEHETSKKAGVFGLSLVATIYNALNVKGYLNDKEKGEKS